jgi:hypothetical protein
VVLVVVLVVVGVVEFADVDWVVVAVLPQEAKTSEVTMRNESDPQIKPFFI